MSQQKANPGTKTIALNRKARHDYHIEQSLEAGIILEGWEVKSLRDGRVQIADSHVVIRRGEMWLIGAHITPLLTASTHINPDPTRIRKLLMHHQEIKKWIGAVDQRGYSIVPLSLYWKNGRAKVEVALVKGKKDYDKRESAKEKDWQRDKARIMRHTQ